MFLDWKNQCCENDYTTQSNLQIQYNLYQTMNGIFHRTRTNKPKINIAPQNTHIAKGILRKKTKAGYSMLPDYKATIITRTDTQTNGTEQRAQKGTHTLMVNKSTTKEARTYNGEKTVSSISGAGKTGQLHVKE